MKDMFMEIHKNEKNENTALILMLGVLKEELTDISDLLTMLNKVANEILSCLKTAKTTPKQENRPMRLLSREDYID